LQAISNGAATARQIVALVYTDVSPKAHAMAERAVVAHLEKLEADQLIKREGEGWTAVDRPTVPWSFRIFTRKSIKIASTCLQVFRVRPLGFVAR